MSMPLVRNRTDQELRICTSGPPSRIHSRTVPRAANSSGERSFTVRCKTELDTNDGLSIENKGPLKEW